MQVKHRWLALCMGPSQPQAGKSIRKEAEVSTPGDGEVAAGDPPRGGRHLEQAWPDLVNKARSVGNPVAVVVHRKDAGIVANAALQQHLEGPQRIPGDGEIRGPVAINRVGDDACQDLEGSLQVGSETFGIQVIDEFMAIPVRRDLVPLVSDLAHQVRRPLGGGTEDEERRPRTGLLQQVEEPTGTHPYAGFELTPVAALDLDALVPVLEVDGKDIDQVTGSFHASAMASLRSIFSR